MTCCRCTRNGTCRGCICAQQGIPCCDCLPKRLYRCSNSQPNHTYNRNPDQDTTETIKNHPPASTIDGESIHPSLNDLPTHHVVDDSTNTSESQPQLQPPISCGDLTTVMFSAIRLKQPLRKRSTGVEISFKYHQDQLGKHSSRNWPASSRPMC